MRKPPTGVGCPNGAPPERAAVDESVSSPLLGAIAGEGTPPPLLNNEVGCCRNAERDNTVCWLGVRCVEGAGGRGLPLSSASRSFASTLYGDADG